MYKLIAHRGYQKDSGENTLLSFLSAINEDKIRGFECDVRESKDHEFIIYHDPLYLGSLVKKLNADEINAPKLEEVLKLKTKKIILIDVKDPFIDTNHLHQILHQYSNQNIYVTSFYPKVIKNLFLKTRNYKVGILNYGLNNQNDQLKYDFLGLLYLLSNNYIIESYKTKGKELFIFGVKEEQIKDPYPYYIVDISFNFKK